MMKLVQTNMFKDCPKIKIIAHRSETMIPYFRGRIESLLKENKRRLQKVLRQYCPIIHTKALESAIDNFGIDRFLYGTDALFGIMTNVAVKEIEDAINMLPISDEEIIYNKDISNFIKNH